jgi:hypothetical protein
MALPALPGLSLEGQTMAKKKTPGNPTPAALGQGTALAFGSEKFCQKCGGNVNFNGCALEDCPVASQDHDE